MADYVNTRTDVPSNQQVIYRRTDGAYIYPNPSDPNFSALSTFLGGGGIPDQPIETTTGIMVVSTGTPSLSAPYLFTTQTKSDILQISIYALANNKFPAGLAQMPWLDVFGNPHTFTLLQWKNFVSALIDYEMAVKTHQNPTLPVTMP